ncbi:MAG: M48 family metalloprotease [Acidobacteriota bacterium]
MFLRTTLLLAVTCLGEAAFGQANPVPTNPGQFTSGMNTFSLDQERTMGAQMSAAALQRATASRDAAAQAYVDRVAGRLAQALPGPSPFPIQFVVVEALALQDQLSAPAGELVVYPGGHVFVPLGLLRSAREDELAGLLAHAMGHVVHRDQTKDQTLAQVIGMATVPLVFMNTDGDHPLIKDGVRQAVNYATPLVIAAMERKFETDADTFAVRLTAAAGYDPDGLEHFIAREPDPMGTLQILLSRYPRPSARAISMQKVIAKLRPLEPHPF